MLSTQRLSLRSSRCTETTNVDSNGIGRIMPVSYQLSLASASACVLSDARGVPIDARFDVGFANVIAGLESYNKHLYRPNTYLHKWWARRCGSTFRLILKHLVENEHQRDYYAPGGLEGKIILDPMMGGGTTLHEAIRLGANVIGADIDPIPVLQARATLSDIPLSHLEAAFDEFSHHAYSFPYTALENNPLDPEKASGTLQSLFHTRVRRARQWALQPKERIIKDGTSRTVTLRGEVDVGAEVSHAASLRSGTRRFLLIQGSSASLDLDADSVDYVVTDPPYFDSVQYSDLAAFFRVWLKHLFPADVQWDYDLSESAVEPHTGGEGQYTEVLSAIFAECHRVLRKDQGRLIFTFHHWNPRGWAALTLALKHAHFVLLNRYVVHSENPVSVHISNLRALTHDAILVLAPERAGAARQWERPATIDQTDSFRFCEGCATMLGWMLGSDLTDVEIELQWNRLLG